MAHIIQLRTLTNNRAFATLLAKNLRISAPATRGFSSSIASESEDEEEKEEQNSFPYIFLNKNPELLKPLAGSFDSDIKSWQKFLDVPEFDLR